MFIYSIIFRFHQIHCRLVYVDNGLHLLHLMDCQCSFCRFWFFKILIIVGVIVGAFFIKDPTFDEGKFYYFDGDIIFHMHNNWILYICMYSEIRTIIVGNVMLDELRSCL